MTIFGIELRSPSTADFLISLMAAGLIAILTAFRIFEPLHAAMLSAASVGAALANGYGASIRKSGWRGAVVSTAFSGMLVALVLLFWAIF